MAFTRVQNGVTTSGSTTASLTTITLPLPSPSTAGNLLIASVVLGAAGFPLTITAVGPSGNPNTSPGWVWCCTSVNGSGGAGEQIEIWAYPNCPAGITNTTWTFANGAGARGHIAEYSSTLAYQVMELFPGTANTAGGGPATSFPVAMGNAVSSGELAVATFGGNYSPATSATWTTPGGWTLNRDTSGSSFALHWASYYQATPSAGAVSVTGVISTSTNQAGWEAAVVVFRETAAVRARVGGSCADKTYTDQASFGFPSTKVGSAKEADGFIGRPFFTSVQNSYQTEGTHLTTGPSGDVQALFNAGIQVCWSLKPRRTGFSGFTTVAAEQAAVDQDLTLTKQGGITGFICLLYNEYQYGGANGPFGNDSTSNGADPYGSGNTEASARTHWKTYWANYQPTLAAHGIPAYASPTYASPVPVTSWLPPAGTISGVQAHLYYGDSAGKQVYLDQSAGTDPQTGNATPALTDVCDGTKNPDGSAASNTPIPLGIGETGRSAGGTFTPWSQVITWSHTGGGTGHLRDLFAARLTANKQNAPILWFELNPGAPNWIHTPGANGEDQTGIQAELAAWSDNLAPQASGTTVTVTTVFLPNGNLGVAYSQALQVTGGAAPYTWALTTGTLPTGLSLSAAGVISGTPSAAGNYAFTVTATDAGSNTGTSGTLSITVAGIAITTTSINPASIGVPYTQTLTEQGGTGPFTWTTTADSVLPAGITLSSAGVLAGTTGASPGPYAFTAVVTDSLSATASAGFTLTVSAGATGGGAPAPLPAGFPQLIIEAGFYAAAPVAVPGALILDDNVGGLLDVGTLSDSTAWTNISTFVRSGSTTRSSSRVQGPLRTYQGGTASVVLANPDGRFDPDNIPGGAYVTGTTSGIRPMVPVRARAIYAGTDYHLFTGFIDTWAIPDTNWGSQYSETTASATDGFKVLAGVTIAPEPASGSGEPSGSRIRRILDAAQWYTDHRRIDAGDSEVQQTTFGDTALNLLQLTADTEIGELYIDGSGNVVFRERQAVLEDTRSTVPQAAFTDPPGYQPLTADSQGFEGGTGTWTQAGNCTIARTTSVFHTGTAALAVTSAAAGNMVAASCLAANILAQGLPCSPGQIIPASAWFLAAASARQVQVGVQFYDTSGTAVTGGLFYGPQVTDSTAGWVQATANIAAPPSSAWCRLSAQIVGTGGASEVHYIDDAVLSFTAGLAYTGVARADDDTCLANDIQITAANSSNLQEAQNKASIAKYLFPRSYSRSDVILTSDAEALTYAQWVLYVSLAEADRFDTLTVTPLRDPALWPQVLGREIGDRITIIRDPPGVPPVAKDVFIRGITHTIDASSNTWQTVWDLDNAARYSGFVILNDGVLGRVSKGNTLAY